MWTCLFCLYFPSVICVNIVAYFISWDIQWGHTNETVWNDLRFCLTARDIGTCGLSLFLFILNTLKMVISVRVCFYSFEQDKNVNKSAIKFFRFNLNICINFFPAKYGLIWLFFLCSGQFSNIDKFLFVQAFNVAFEYQKYAKYLIAWKHFREIKKTINWADNSISINFELFIDNSHATAKHRYFQLNLHSSYANTNIQKLSMVFRFSSLFHNFN